MLITEIKSIDGEKSIFDRQRSEEYFEYKIYWYVIGLNTLGIVIKTITTISILYYRKYLFTIFKRIRNESIEQFLSSNSSFNNIVYIDQTFNSNFQNISMLRNENTQINTFNYIKNNVNVILNTNDKGRFHTDFKKHNSIMKTMDDSPDVHQEVLFNDKFETPKKMKFKTSDCS
jgi:hypothetical protein